MLQHMLKFWVLGLNILRHCLMMFQCWWMLGFSMSWVLMSWVTGLQQGCPWVHLWQIQGFFFSLKQAQEHLKQPRNWGDMVKTMKRSYLLHFWAVLDVLGLGLKSKKSPRSIIGALMDIPNLQWSDVWCWAKYFLDETQGDIGIILGICILMSLYN